MEAITKIFTTEDQKELKNSFKEIICNEFETQLKEMDLYFVDPSDIEELIKESFEEIIDEVKKEFKIKLQNQIMQLLETNDIEKLIGLNKK